MKVSSKKISDTRIELTVSLDAKELAAAKEKAAARLAKDVKVEGFRAGKVPVDVALKHIPESELNSMTLDIAVRTSVPRAFDEAKQAPVMIPKVEVDKFVPDEMAEYKAEADIIPEIKLGDYKHLKAAREAYEAAENEIDDIVENIRSAYAEHKAGKKTAETGDEVVIDFEGSVNGEKFKGGSAKDYKLTLGSHQFIPGFEEGVAGHTVGERFDVEVTFPKDYHAEELKGKKAVFNILLKQVNEIVKPAADDELAKKCGPFKTIAELRADIKKNVEAQNKVKSDEKFKDDLVNELIAKSKVSAPEVLIEDQLNYIKNDITANARRQGMEFADYLKQTAQTEADWLKSARPVAEARVKASLILQVLARDEKIEAAEEIVDAKLAELREVYKKSEEALKNLKDPNVRQDVKNRLTIEKVLNQLVEWNDKPAVKKAERPASKKAAPDKAVSKKAAPKKTVPEKAASKKPAAKTEKPAAKKAASKK